MKLKVEGIEEIEITDPLGLSNPPAPQAIPPQPQRPALPGDILPRLPSVGPTPLLPSPFNPGPMRTIPGTGVVAVPHKPPMYTRHLHNPNDPLLQGKWGVGGPAIRQAAQTTDPDKWQKNWQATMSGEKGQENDNQHNH